MNPPMKTMLMHWRIFILPCLAAGVAQAVATLFLTIEWSAATSMGAALLVAAVLAEAHFDLRSGLRTSLRQSTAAALSQAGPLAVLITAAGLIAAAAPHSIMGELLSWFLLPCVALAIPVCVMERRGIGECLQRCARLTAGSRLPTFFTLFVATYALQRIHYRTSEGWMGPWGLGLYPLVTAYCAAAATGCYQRLSVEPSGNQN